MTCRISDSNPDWNDDTNRIVRHFDEAVSLFDNEDRSNELRNWSSFEVAAHGCSNKMMAVGNDGHIV